MRVSGWLNALSVRLSKRSSSVKASRRGRARSRRYSPIGAELETLEQRTLLSSIVVNSFLDTVDASPGDGMARDSAGRTTLRAAIMEANALAGSNTIILGAGTYGLTRSGINNNNAVTGDLDISDATGSLTIQGAGAGSTFIDANDLDRVLDIFPGVTVHLKGLTITGGKVDGDHVHGGGIFNQGTLTITDSIITGNSVTGRAAGGGGIYNTVNATLTVKDSNISGNSATAVNSAGGGITNAGTMTIKGSRFANNTAYNGGAIATDAQSTTTITDTELSVNSATNVGGAIVNIGGGMTLTNSEIRSNSSGAHGAGLFNANSNSTVTINNSLFEGNATANFEGDDKPNNGGAIYNLYGTVSLVSGTIRENSANYGGGIGNNGGTLVIKGTRFEANSATENGGGIWTLANGQVSVSDAVFSGNTARFGGALWNDATLVVERTTIDGNVAAADGGGIVNAGSLTLTNSTISNNEANYGGGLSNAGGTATVANSTFGGNTAAELGGGISNFNSGTLTITSSTISDNHADVGGGLWNDSGVGAGNNIIAGNSAVTAAPDIYGAYNPDSIAHNLIGDVGPATGITNGVNGNLVGGKGNAVIDPKLGPLADNGGPTKTFALSDDSPAVDAGKNVNLPAKDQRGVNRQLDGDFDGTATVDLGAYEYQAKPKALGPIDNTIDTTPTFRWTAIPGAERYDLWVNNLTTGQSGVIRNADITTNEFTPVGKLIVGHSYIWTVRGIGSDGGSAWAEHARFTVTEPKHAAAPNKTDLPYGTIDTTPTFQWEAVEGAARYDIWVNDLTTGQNGVIRRTDITTNSFTPTKELAAGHSYLWSVRVITEEGLVGEFGPNDLFSIAVAPVLETPVGGGTDPTPTFTWTPIPGAARYDIWVNDQTTGKSGIIRRDDVTQASFTPTTELPGGHRYIWTVRAIDESGQGGAWAAHRTFSLAATLLSPVHSTIDATPTFKWSDVEGAVAYELWVNNQTTGKYKVIYDQGVSENTYTPTNPLTVGHRYIWTVRPIYGNGQGGLWSAHRTFTVQTPQSVAPPNLGTPNDPTDTTPTLTWSEVPGAARYHVWVNNVTTGKIGVIYDTHVAGTSYTPTTPLTPGHTYIWTVIAFNEDGAGGKQAAHQRFTIAKLQAPDSEAPGSATSETKPEFAWSAVAGAARYHLWVNDLTTGQIGVIYNTHVTGNTFRPSQPLVVGHRYIWTVVAINADGVEGEWAQHRTFTVTELPAPTMKSPGSTAVGLQPTFSWSAVPGADRYDIWVNNLTTGQSGVIRDRNVQGTSYTPSSPLAAGHKYIWTVTGIREDGTTGTWAAHQTFFVAHAPKAQSLTSSTTQTTPTFQWTPIAGAARYDLWVNDQTTGQNQVIRNLNIATNSYTPSTPLTAGHRYIWTVRAIDANGQGGAWAKHATFTITLAASSSTLSIATEASDDSETDASPELELRRLERDDTQPSAPTETTDARDWVFAAWDQTEWWTSNERDERRDEAGQQTA